MANQRWLADNLNHYDATPPWGAAPGQRVAARHCYLWPLRPAHGLHYSGQNGNYPVYLCRADQHQHGGPRCQEVRALELAGVAKQTKVTLETERLDVVADRGYFNGAEILACEKASITVTLPKPMTSNAKADGRFGKQDFRYVADEDVYICPAGERLVYHYTNEENGLVLRRY